MKVVATGTTGTIGKHLGQRVSPVNLDFGEPNFQFNGEELNPGDSFLHLAAVVGPTAVEKDTRYSRQVNVEAVIRLGSEFLNSSGEKFVYVSTSHVYSSSNLPIEESFETEPKNLYAVQKLEAEDILSEMFVRHPERLSIVRVFSVLDWDVDQFTLGGGVRKLKEENSDYILNNCDDVRDFLTPKVIADALVRICKESSLFGIVNLCSGRGLSVGEAARQMLGPEASTKASHRMVPGQSATPFIVGNNSKLTSALPDLDLRWVPSTLT